ncbi:MAG: bifunctional chorismate mutase/prephenate dehydratase [Clostridiales bacterium]|nr:bifunctional chorismate mutase/prephenate dehydratase [Clostridiales bacterium]
MDLKNIRNQLDTIDDQMIALFAQRMQLVSQVAEYKKEKGLPILDTGRERQIINRVSLAAGEELEHYAKLMYQTLFNVSRAHQAERLRPASSLSEKLEKAAENVQQKIPGRAMVACQGTEGAYSQKICDRMFEFADILYMNTFNDVFNAVESGMCPFGILPIENSTAGSVTQVYDLMEKHHFHIVRAARQRIEHRLLALPGVKIGDIREIVSHEQALRQCSAFLSAHPEIKVTVMENTAVAAAHAASSNRKDLAAIASRECCGLYGLECLSDQISDTPNNSTRFICIAKDLTVYEGANKISLMLSAAHQPGSLYRLLTHIAVTGLNLTKLESRPMPGKDFEFRFFFDLEGSILDPAVRGLISQLQQDSDQFVFLGNYEEMR